MKKVSLILLFLSLFTFSVFAQEEESFVDEESFDENLFDEEKSFDDEESFDMYDFDSIFADAEDLEEPVKDPEPEKGTTPAQIIASAFSSMVHFSGTFNGDVGVLYAHRKNTDENGNDKNDDVSGYISLKNKLNMSIVPADFFSVKGSLFTGIDNDFKIEVTELYFNYLLLNTLYISAGKKSISWGNIRLFNSEYYGCDIHSMCLYSTGPKYADIFSEDDVPLAIDIKYPWSWGTITVAATGNIKPEETPHPNNFNYYGSLEFSVLNTNFNIYGKRCAQNTDPIRNPLFGLEVKRTILGFDTYAQGIARVKNFTALNSPDGYDYVIATAGMYRLFDSFDPNIGFNIEYQYEFNPASEAIHYHRIAFEGGLKRIGKKKNMKIGVMSHYNFTDNHGFSGLNFIVSGLFPYAEWSNKVAVGYGSKYPIPTIMLSSALTLVLDY